MISAEIERCAGIDVGKEQLAVTVMVGPLAGEPRTETREFGTISTELKRLRQWLQAEGVTQVVMESTGSYWKSVFNVLEDGFKVYSANPHEVKNRKGHKTDKKDSWWLAHLLRHAMIRPSFVPPRRLRELRDLTPGRRKMIDVATSERERVERILQERETQQRFVGHLRGLRSVDAGSVAERQGYRRADRPVCPTQGETQDFGDYRRVGRASDE
jgi:transposase